MGCCIAHSAEAVDAMAAVFSELGARLQLLPPPEGHAQWLSDSGRDETQRLPVAWKQALRELQGACLHHH